MAGRKKVPGRRGTGSRGRGTLEIRSIRVIDGAGRPRIALDVTRAGPRLAMMHEDGTVALELTLAANGPGIRLTDESGRTRVFAGAPRGAARLGMADADGAQRLLLGVSAAGGPSITLYDGAQRRVWTVGKNARPGRS